MKRQIFITIPLLIIISLILAGCAIDRRDDDGGITPVDEVGQTPQTGEPAPSETEEVPDEGETDPETASVPDDISTEQFPAPVAPAAEPLEGKVLIKLELQAAIQARSAELGANGIVETENPTINQMLSSIGASDLEPVVEEVAQATGDTIEAIEAQSEDAVQLYSITFDPANDPQAVAAMLSQDPSVEFAEPDYPAGITANPVYLPHAFDPNDPYYQYQWNFPAIQIPAAWDKSTGEGVRVAIIDTGIDFNTPDLLGSRHLQGYDFFNNDTDPTDDQGHGTHVAGTVAQTTNNGVGVAGVAFNAELLPIKVLGANGEGSYEAIIQGIYYAVDQGADVINMSLAGRAGSQALREAVQFAHENGVVVVAAAGNSAGPVEFPAAYDEYVIAVGSSRVDNALAPYSNFGSQIDLVAPGGDVGVDQNGDGFADGILQQTFKTPGQYTYLFFEGTSMASPHVAGVAALIRSHQPGLSPNDVKNIMMQTALNLGPPENFGAGLVQARAALDALDGGVTPPTAEPTTEPTAQPTTEPTVEPTTEPTVEPTTEPTVQPTVEPTAQPTAEPTTPPPVAGDLLTNGSFEGGEGWVFGDTPIPGSYSDTITLSGSRSVLLGNVSGRDWTSYSSIWQKVSIPAEATTATLTANLYQLSQDSGGDIQYIAILDSNFRVKSTLMAELRNTQAWENRSFDLSAYSGQTIYVYFSVFNRGSTGRLTAMYVDDVSLVVGN